MSAAASRRQSSLRVLRTEKLTLSQDRFSGYSFSFKVKPYEFDVKRQDFHDADRLGGDKATGRE